jgi:hypothetical protein
MILGLRAIQRLHLALALATGLATTSAAGAGPSQPPRSMTVLRGYIRDRSLFTENAAAVGLISAATSDYRSEAQGRPRATEG